MSAAPIFGYAAVFGRPDQSGDVIAPGAFAASLKRRATAGVRMLWHHDPARPVGRWTRIVEDARGLLVEGELATGTDAGREAAGLIAAGALDGLSIGFRARRARSGRASRGRTLLAVDLWEISLVSFPMQEAARLALPRRSRRPPPAVATNDSSPRPRGDAR